MTKPTALLFAVATLALTACSTSKPTLYPNDQYNKVGAAQADQDIANCEAQAKAFCELTFRCCKDKDRVRLFGSTLAYTNSEGECIDRVTSDCTDMPTFSV